MKIVAISDTHGLHRNLQLPKGDLIIHAGDISDFGKKEEVLDFFEWFSRLDYKYKIFIGGNHDTYLDEHPVDLLNILPPNTNYLNNRSLVLEGIKFWGSPVTPDLEGWAFGKNRNEMADHWKYMPREIDVLITHTPPFGILDKSSRHVNLGCKNLLGKVNKINPKFHIFGHVHASYGVVHKNKTTFLNASNLNSYKGLINQPLFFDI